MASWRTLRGRGAPHLRAAEAFMVAMVPLLGAGVALTSLESRHFEAILAPAFWLALWPNLSRPGIRWQYMTSHTVLLSLMLLVHTAWFVVKLG